MMPHALLLAYGKLTSTFISKASSVGNGAICLSVLLALCISPRRTWGRSGGHGQLQRHLDEVCTLWGVDPAPCDGVGARCAASQAFLAAVVTTFDILCVQAVR